MRISECIANSETFLICKRNDGALAGVAQWIERGPMNQRVAGSIPSQSTCLGCGLGPQ